MMWCKYLHGFINVSHICIWYIGNRNYIFLTAPHHVVCDLEGYSDSLTTCTYLIRIFQDGLWQWSMPLLLFLSISGLGLEYRRLAEKQGSFVHPAMISCSAYWQFCRCRPITVLALGARKECKSLSRLDSLLVLQSSHYIIDNRFSNKSFRVYIIRRWFFVSTMVQHKWLHAHSSTSYILCVIKR